MENYKCKNCGYQGSKLIFQMTDYDYCLASNEIEPEYINRAPKWVRDKGFGEIEIGEPVGCPKCRAWGINNFEIV